MELSERCIQMLEREGFPYISERSDAPHTRYEINSQNARAVVFVTEGKLSIEQAGSTTYVQAGDRIAILPHISYRLTIGDTGCQILIGEMRANDVTFS